VRLIVGFPIGAVLLPPCCDMNLMLFPKSRVSFGLDILGARIAEIALVWVFASRINEAVLSLASVALSDF